MAKWLFNALKGKHFLGDDDLGGGGGGGSSNIILDMPFTDADQFADNSGNGYEIQEVGTPVINTTVEDPNGGNDGVLQVSTGNFIRVLGCLFGQIADQDWRLSVDLRWISLGRDGYVGFTDGTEGLFFGLQNGSNILYLA